MKNLTKLSSKKSKNLFAGSFPCTGVMELRAVLSLFLLLGTLSVVLDVKKLNAEETNSSGQMGIAEELVEESRGELRLGARASLGLESNAYVWGTRDHVTTSTASAESSLAFDRFTLMARLAASRVIKETEEWEWAEDFRLRLSRPWQLSKNLKLGTSASLILPITEFSRKYSLLEQGTAAALSLNWNLNRVVRGLSVTTATSGTYYDYATPVAFDGRSNESWRLNTRLSASWEFVKNISIDVLFGRTWAWSTYGNQFDRFEMEQSLSWEATKIASVSVGHSRGGNMLRADNNSNLALYDNRDSSFYLSLDLSI